MHVSISSAGIGIPIFVKTSRMELVETTPRTHSYHRLVLGITLALERGSDHERSGSNYPSELPLWIVRHRLVVILRNRSASRKTVHLRRMSLRERDERCGAERWDETVT
jgi:hypothetical protein